MRTLVLLLCVFVTSFSSASVYQRFFLPSDTSTSPAAGADSHIRWASGTTIPMHIFDWGAGNLGSASTLDFSEVHAVTAPSIAEWLVPGADLLSIVPNIAMLLDGSSRPVAQVTNDCMFTVIAGPALTTDGTNNVLFDTRANAGLCNSALGASTVGLTVVQFYVSTGQIVEADMIYNDTTQTFIDTKPNAGSINLQGVMTHEFGHLFGLDHDNNRRATMYFNVAEDLEDAKKSDQLGIMNLYPSATTDATYGRVIGSVSQAATPFWGAHVLLLNARTLEVEATAISDQNGRFDVGYALPGEYIVLARRYHPVSTSLGDYYEGDDTGNPAHDPAGFGCYNHSCTVIDTAMGWSFYDKAVALGAGGGRTFKIVDVVAGATSQYINIELNPAEPTFTELPDVTNDTNDATNVDRLAVDEPRVALIDVDPTPLNSIDTDTYNFVVAAPGTYDFHVSMLRLFGRVEMTMQLLDNLGADVTGNCTTTVAADFEGRATDVVGTGDPLDPALLDCALIPGESPYVLVLTGAEVACASIPGNTGGTCATEVAGSAASNPVALYVVSAIDQAIATGITGDTLDVVTNAISTFLSSSVSSSFSVCTGSVCAGASSSAGSCGTITNGGPGGPNNFYSWLLAVLFNPILLLLLAKLFIWGRRKKAI